MYTKLLIFLCISATPKFLMYLTNYGDVKQTKMSKFGSEQIRLNNLIFLCLEETTSAAKNQPLLERDKPRQRYAKTYAAYLRKLENNLINSIIRL